MHSFDLSRLAPTGLAIDGVEDGEDVLIIAAHAILTRGRCPDCATWSDRVHSRYIRKLNDLPIGGRSVQLAVRARRFYCDAVSCHRMTFAERFDGVVAPMARRTSRLDEIVFCLAIALGGRPAAALAGRFDIKISNDTLLRTVRRRRSPETPAPSVIGVDDWPDDAIFATVRSFAILSAERRSRFCPIGNPRPLKRGCGNGPKSRSSRAIAAAPMPWRQNGRCPKPSRSLIAGISWRTLARLFSTPSANPCARSGQRSARRPSIPRC